MARYMYCTEPGRRRLPNVILCAKHWREYKKKIGA